MGDNRSFVANNNEISLVSYYNDILVRPVPTSSSSINQCVLKGWLHELGKYLDLDGMRLYLFDDRSNQCIVQQIFGNKDIWRDVDITRFHREKTVFKDLFFVKIRHFRENGQYIILGYLSFHTEHYVSEALLSSLDVLCMLYGNYIVKRLVTGHRNRIDTLLPEIYSVAAADSLPGTKIQKILDCIHRISAFNFGLYCTMHDNSIVAEYIANNKGCTYLRRHSTWSVGDGFVGLLKCYSPDDWYVLSDLPSEIVSFILYRDKRSPDTFFTKVFPVFVDGELIGLWLFVFSENNPHIDYSVNSILDGTYPLLKDSYRFLFQRRFSYMIVNPIFQYRDTRVNKDSVFVIMPFTQDWSNDIWQQVIKPAVQEIGMTPIRADDLYGQNIMEDVWQSILKAALIICDTSGRNPNVFYELGIAHTLGKKVLLLTQSINDIPFDLQAYRHIEYQVSISGGNHLKETLKKYIKETLSSK